MPYFLKQVGKKYFVEDTSGKRYSKKPLSKLRAERQMKALHINTGHGLEVAVGFGPPTSGQGRKKHGGMNTTLPNLRASTRVVNPLRQVLFNADGVPHSERYLRFRNPMRQEEPLPDQEPAPAPAPVPAPARVQTRNPLRGTIPMVPGDSGIASAVEVGCNTLASCFGTGKKKRCGGMMGQQAPARKIPHRPYGLNPKKRLEIANKFENDTCPVCLGEEQKPLNPERVHIGNCGHWVHKGNCYDSIEGSPERSIVVDGVVQNIGTKKCPLCNIVGFGLKKRCGGRLSETWPILQKHLNELTGEFGYLVTPAEKIKFLEDQMKAVLLEMIPLLDEFHEKKELITRGTTYIKQLSQNKFRPIVDQQILISEELAEVARQPIGQIVGNPDSQSETPIFRRLHIREHPSISGNTFNPGDTRNYYNAGFTNEPYPTEADAAIIREPTTKTKTLDMLFKINQRTGEYYNDLIKAGYDAALTPAQVKTRDELQAKAKKSLDGTGRKLKGSNLWNEYIRPGIRWLIQNNLHHYAAMLAGGIFRGLIGINAGPELERVLGIPQWLSIVAGVVAGADNGRQFVQEFEAEVRRQTEQNRLRNMEPLVQHVYENQFPAPEIPEGTETELKEDITPGMRMADVNRTARRFRRYYSADEIQQLRNVAQESGGPFRDPLTREPITSVTEYNANVVGIGQGLFGNDPKNTPPPSWWKNPEEKLGSGSRYAKPDTHILIGNLSGSGQWEKEYYAKANIIPHVNQRLLAEIGTDLKHRLADLPSSKYTAPFLSPFGIDTRKGALVKEALATLERLSKISLEHPTISGVQSYQEDGRTLYYNPLNRESTLERPGRPIEELVQESRVTGPLGKPVVRDNPPKYGTIGYVDTTDIFNEIQPRKLQPARFRDIMDIEYPKAFKLYQLETYAGEPIEWKKFNTIFIKANYPDTPSGHVGVLIRNLTNPISYTWYDSHGLGWRDPRSYFYRSRDILNRIVGDAEVDFNGREHQCNTLLCQSFAKIRATYPNLTNEQYDQELKRTARRIADDPDFYISAAFPVMRSPLLGQVPRRLPELSNQNIRDTMRAHSQDVAPVIPVIPRQNYHESGDVYAAPLVAQKVEQDLIMNPYEPVLFSSARVRPPPPQAPAPAPAREWPLGRAPAIRAPALQATGPAGVGLGLGKLKFIKKYLKGQGIKATKKNVEKICNIMDVEGVLFE